MSDRLTLMRVIEDAGIDRDKAERVASVIVDLIHAEVATKADLQAVKLELKGDIASNGADLRRTELALKADIAAGRANSDLIEHRLLTRLGGLTIVVGGVLFAALHYWPPGHPP
jgi:3-oxoacyl-ACP reductase-like protein